MIISMISSMEEAPKKVRVWLCISQIKREVEELKRMEEEDRTTTTEVAAAAPMDPPVDWEVTEFLQPHSPVPATLQE